MLKKKVITPHIFGGQLSYRNIKSYLYTQGFDIIKDEKNYNNLLKKTWRT